MDNINNMKMEKVKCSNCSPRLFRKNKNKDKDKDKIKKKRKKKRKTIKERDDEDMKMVLMTHVCVTCALCIAF